MGRGWWLRWSKLTDKSNQNEGSKRRGRWFKLDTRSWPVLYVFCPCYLQLVRFSLVFSNFCFVIVNTLLIVSWNKNTCNSEQCFRFQIPPYSDWWNFLRNPSWFSPQNLENCKVWLFFPPPHPLRCRWKCWTLPKSLSSQVAPKCNLGSKETAALKERYRVVK